MYAPLRYYIVYLISIVTRFFPLPTKTGIIRIGNPNENSPVLITCNYRLTVEILKKELKGQNLYLLVANSNGINVWCAATGGHFTNHDIISVLKTSGIAEQVDHRDYILPQLSATGIEPRIIKGKTGWNGRWGPTYANQIPNFLSKHTDFTQNQVKFQTSERIELACAWAFLMSIFFFIIIVWFSLNLAVVTFVLSWIITLTIFFTFPYYESFLKNQKKLFYFEKGKLLVELAFSMIFITLIFVMDTQLSLLTFEKYILAGLILLMVVIVVTDMKGMTPTFKSDLHEDRLFTIKIHQDQCTGIGDCELVCPRNCFEFVDEVEYITIPRIDDCVQCGACIVQCPEDALYFKNSKGEIIQADIIRKYKLNLLGKRASKACNCTVCKITT
ncbi:MAG: Acetyl-CoA decarbonylase/synthase complex subunit gamma [Candidatus Heimdallarchaeota archaeon LC_2]|nr:MAG: Acetyl-CoA decarbonylase/synthase complex subunit gamma [Candidatus Heimdallarchaeota archaeon LC_2]